MSAQRTVALIDRKRDGGALTRDEFAWLVNGFLDGEIGEGPMGALLMAGLLRGFSDEEAIALTDVLVATGTRLDLSSLPGPTVDKHSTGGVGDTTTLVVVPLLAAAGAYVVKLSGRGLGHTGGTIDKLESIPGVRTTLSIGEMLAVAREIGCVVAAQSDELVPGDRALYRLRDRTGTVESPALIAASVMAKKLAAGAETIVLDVKAGDGAFLRDADEARELARLCVRIGAQAQRRCVALVTAMDQPLGRAIGNALEVREAVQLLQAAPDQTSRLAMLALDLGAHALLAAGSAAGVDSGRERLARLWASGHALERLRAMVVAQGGDPAVCDDPAGVLPVAPVTVTAAAAATGTVTAIPARAVGEVVAVLGAGRRGNDATVDPATGVQLQVAVGDRVERGDPVGLVHARTRGVAEEAARRLAALVVIDDPAPRAGPTVLDVITPT